jgi:hypothetical protein
MPGTLGDRRCWHIGVEPLRGGRVTRSYGRPASGDATCAGVRASCRASAATREYVDAAITLPCLVLNGRPSPPPRKGKRMRHGVTLAGRRPPW